MTVTLYGIPNCDSCRAARKWLTAADIEHGFHDLRAEPVSAERLDSWLAEIGWEKLLNRRGKTWRELPQQQRDAIDPASARDLLQAHPLLIKRPVLEHGERVTCGFSASTYESLLGSAAG